MLPQLVEGIETLCTNDTRIKCLVESRKEEIIKLLSRYIKEIELFNSAYGLVGTSDTEQIVIRHILDCLAPLGIISGLLEKHTGTTPHIADFGSGAGLPGIPLAIAMPNCNFTLIERMGRRSGFLQNTSAVLSSCTQNGFSNITVEEGEYEKTEKEKFSIVTFRALANIDKKNIKYLFNACITNGFIAAYKGKLDKIKQEMQILEKTNNCWEAVPYTVPFLDEERHLLVIKNSGNI